MTVRVAVVDNEPMFVEAMRFYLEKHLDPGGVVVGHTKPRDLRSDPDVASLTHAVIDISFGPYDLASPDMAAESETAVDALLHLEELAPNCRPILTTAMADDLAREVAVVVRQTWPGVPILNKNDGRVGEQVSSFVSGSPTVDNAEWGRLVYDIEPIPPQRIGDAVRGCAETRPVARLALALADFDRQPTALALADRLSISPSRVATLLNLLGSTLRNTGSAVLDFDTNGLELWGWARPRRPLLDRQFAGLLGGDV